MLRELYDSNCFLMLDDFFEGIADLIALFQGLELANGAVYSGLARSTYMLGRSITQHASDCAMSFRPLSRLFAPQRDQFEDLAQLPWYVELIWQPLNV